MHLWIFNHRSTRRSDGLHHFILCFPDWTYLGLVGKADSPPIVFTPALWSGWLLPVGFFFYAVYFKHFGLLEKNWGHHSVLEGSSFNFWCPIFLRRFRSCWLCKFSLTILSAKAAEFFPTPDLLRGLRYCCRVADIHTLICWRSIWYLIFPQKVPCFLGAPNILGGTVPRLQAMSWEFLSLNYYFVLQRQTFLFGYLPCNRINLVPVFPLFSVKKERIK